jgi:hypothetical protein
VGGTAEIDAAFVVELGRIREILGDRRVPDLFDAPPMQDEVAIARESLTIDELFIDRRYINMAAPGSGRTMSIAADEKLQQRLGKQ